MVYPASFDFNFAETDDKSIHQYLVEVNSCYLLIIIDKKVIFLAEISKAALVS
jgi:hypothetical protein